MALGGMTVGELKQRMTPQEIQQWVLFEHDNGPLHIGIRIDRAVAAAVRPFLKDEMTKRPPSMRQLMPWPIIEEPEATPEDLMNLLMSVAKKPSVKKNG